MENDDPQIEWEKFSISVFEENKIIDIELNSKIISIVFNSNKLYAFQSKCPHSGANFSDGFLDKNICLVCPLHKFKFKLSNGLNVTGEGYRLKIYPTKFDKDNWYIGIKKETQI